MQSNLLQWSAAISAIHRIPVYQAKLAVADTYFDRLRITNDALGGNWVFRLADVVGLETIKMNRLSWYQFYIQDIDRLHCPLDPGAPETEAYLGLDYSVMDMAFYAGMGFDGYQLALNTGRHVDMDEKEIMFDGRYHLHLPGTWKEELQQYDRDRVVPKEDYYAAYGDALSVLYDAIHAKPTDDEALERLVSACLIFLCGGHTGCLKHITDEIQFKCQMESLIIFRHAKGLVTGAVNLGEEIGKLRAVS